jgi:hypothetical protein
MSTVALELAIVVTKRRSAWAMGLVPMKKEGDFMLEALSLKVLQWQVVKSIRQPARLGLKKLAQWSILGMYPMKQLVFG